MTDLRGLLDSADYSNQRLVQRLALDENLIFRRTEVPVLLRRLNHRDALDTLIRLFLLNVPLPAHELAAAVSSRAIEELTEEGILENKDDHLRSSLRITPAGGLILAHDAAAPDALGTDSVLGWTPSGRSLASITVRRQVERTLDVGTGCGVQALLAARHSEHVVAVDLNPRALWLTNLNCELNEVSNVECRLGDFFEPVRDERFDMIVSNPPFVISPSHNYLFRDAGREGDALSRMVVQEAASLLKEGGYAHVMCNWVSEPGEPWWSGPAEWLTTSGCDALLLHSDTLDPLRYASVWNESISSQPEAFAATLDDWLGFYDRSGIASISLGAAILRRRNGAANWISKAELLRGPSRQAGRHVERVFAAEDVAELLEDDDAVLGQAFGLVNGHRLEQKLTYGEGRYTAEDAVILLDEGVPVRNRVPAGVLQVLLRFDGVTPLGELVEQAADETGFPPENLSHGVIETVRELFFLGLIDLPALRPAG